MTSQYDKAKRWRPRFSVRTLVIVVTLVCVYLGCWRVTKTQGVDDVAMHISLELLSRKGSPEDPIEFVRRVNYWDAAAVSPFVVGVIKVDDVGSIVLPDYHNKYYFWFFGYVAKLPYEREL